MFKEVYNRKIRTLLKECFVDNGVSVDTDKYMKALEEGNLTDNELCELGVDMIRLDNIREGYTELVEVAEVFKGYGWWVEGGSFLDHFTLDVSKDFNGYTYMISLGDWGLVASLEDHLRYDGGDGWVESGVISTMNYEDKFTKELLEIYEKDIQLELYEVLDVLEG